MVAIPKPEKMHNSYVIKKLLKVRRASKKDVDAIYEVACSVGTSEKVAEQGFLVDDYQSDPVYYKRKIKKSIERLEHFYVAEYDKIYGFMIAYNKNEWIEDNPSWMQDTFWKPDFDMSKTEDFVVVDKTAIRADLTGIGIGSLIYEKLLEDLNRKQIENIFAETIISPQPNFASLNFRNKQRYNLAGVRYEFYNDMTYTDLIYHKSVR